MYAKQCSSAPYALFLECLGRALHFSVGPTLGLAKRKERSDYEGSEKCEQQTY